MAQIGLKRGYDPASEDDGLRVLVERLWLRGLTKERARLDAWMKDVAPSAELRTWFGHRPERWAEFVERYRAELAGADRRPALAALQAAARSTLTLVFGAADREQNSAVVLRDVLTAKPVALDDLSSVILTVSRAVADARPEGLAPRAAIEGFLGGAVPRGEVGSILQSLEEQGRLQRTGDCWRPTRGGGVE
jgi:DNA-3-methyladenine glycosylase